MVNHVHISIHPEARLSRITKAIKNHSARQANAIFAHHWAHRLAVLARVRGPEELAKIVRYIEKNPVVAGWRAEGHVHLR
jgi:REP element-mobilizing transposase RayT